MKNFEVIALQQSTTLYLSTLREEIDMEPAYQRMSDVWTKSKRQMLIDTLINGFDMPKIYFHEFSKPKPSGDGEMLRYAVIDGKQRLQSIFEFMDNTLPLASDFSYLPDDTVDLRNMTYQELGKKYPRIKLRFDALVLPVFAIRTDDGEIIEDMFSRLNEASPLNAAEKRNAYGGPLPPVIRKLVKHDFFGRKVRFSSSRYRHHDIATKLMYQVYRDAIVDTKKSQLDHFVESFKKYTEDDALRLSEETERVLDGLRDSFSDNDPLLKSIGLIPVYFWLSRLKGDFGFGYELDRSNVAAFSDYREKNRRIAAEDESGERADYELLEFDRLVQSPNDAYSIRYKCEVMAKYVLEKKEAEAVIDKLIFAKGEVAW